MPVLPDHRRVFLAYLATITLPDGGLANGPNSEGFSNGRRRSSPQAQTHAASRPRLEEDHDPRPGAVPESVQFLVARNVRVFQSPLTLQPDVLHVLSPSAWTGFPAFEAALRRPGPWIAGIDFPFGLPRFVGDVGWPPAWREYVRHARSLGKKGFEAELGHVPGEAAGPTKEHRRATDVLAGSLSPQNLHGTPLGKMFFQGAPRLVEATVETRDSRMATKTARSWRRIRGAGALRHEERPKAQQPVQADDRAARCPAPDPRCVDERRVGAAIRANGRRRRSDAG